jgi:hypothetical protein
MQKPRRWRWLQLYVLPLAMACSGAEAPAPRTAARKLTPAPAAEPKPPAMSVPLVPPRALGPAAAGGEATLAAGPPETDGPAAAAPPPGTKVLQVGDSFADALAKELGKLLKDAGLHTTVVSKTPSYIGDWAYGSTLATLLSKYQPDLVLITLGANELEIPDPAARIGPVQRLVARASSRPCVWILPPLWKKDTGVMQVIKEHAKPCLVLDSTSLVGELPRLPDGIHPSTAGRVTWAAAVMRWLNQRRDPSGPEAWSLRAGEP